MSVNFISGQLLEEHSRLAYRFRFRWWWWLIYDCSPKERIQSPCLRLRAIGILGCKVLGDQDEILVIYRATNVCG
jgi:hypothetical protein